MNLTPSNGSIKEVITSSTDKYALYYVQLPGGIAEGLERNLTNFIFLIESETTKSFISFEIG